MMPLLDKLISSRKSTENNSDCRLLLNIGIGPNDRSGSYFGADQVRILLFRECESRGRKLLFDSVSARKPSSVNTAINDSSRNLAKQGNGSCARNATGLVPEHEKVACDDVSLLSEMVFGTVAMTYRGPLFKVHALSAPRCIMCTKVFPAPDHNAQKPSDRLSDDTLGHSINFDSTSSVGSLRNTISHLSSGHFSGNSLCPDLRKNSTCSSNSSGWDIDIPLLSSSQSLESNCSSGFGSLTSLRRRWLRAVSTTLTHSQLDEILGIQPYNDNTENDPSNHRRHITRLGLAVLIQLTPGHERQMEARLLEHAAQLEGMLNRLCYACIESCRTHGKSNGECKSLTLRMRRASGKCIAWLLRSLSQAESAIIPSLWHEVIMNSAIPVAQRTQTLHRNLHQMCQLLEGVDTKSTNFFLSTIVTAILTHHLGWVQTVMSPHDKQLMENLGRRYPCNPLWAQLGDLYGALGNPPKLVHTVVAGDSEKASLINAVLSFLSYFVRSAIVEKRRESRCPTQEDVSEAIAVLERMTKKNDGTLDFRTSTSSTSASVGSSISSRDEASSKIPRGASTTPESSPTPTKISLSEPTTLNDCKIIVDDSTVPRLKRTRSVQKNLDDVPTNTTNSRGNYPVKVKTCDDDDANVASLITLEKELPTSTVKIIVSETTSPSVDAGGTIKRISENSRPYDLDDKMELRDYDRGELTMDDKLNSLGINGPDGDYDSQKCLPGVNDDTEVFFARLDITKNVVQQSQVFFTLGDEEKSFEQRELHNRKLSRGSIDCNCQCSFAFNRVPSTSAELPEGVLRKIIQRNFPESSKSIERPDGSSLRNERFVGSCPKCNGAGYSGPQTYEGGKLLLETPTNATEVLRTCANSGGSRSTRFFRSNSLEAFMEASGVVELPMPRSKKVLPTKKEVNEISGFTRTLLQRRVTNVGSKCPDPTIYDCGYTSGLVVQGLTKGKRKKDNNANEERTEMNWLSQLRDEVDINAKFPIIDQPVSEALCILADLDNWQVGILSSTSSVQNPLLPVGMSRLVGTMLESFAYLWTKYRSPSHCIGIFEGKLREMWLRSEALAEMLMAGDVCEVTIDSLTKALDLDAADIPLLLAVATTHSPQIAQRFGISLA